MKTLKRNKSNTKAGDSGAPVMQNSKIVAMHVGGMKDLDYNVCILTSWKDPTFRRMVSSLEPLLPSVESFKADAGVVEFEYVAEGKQKNDYSSTTSSKQKHNKEIYEQMEEAKQAAEKRRRDEEDDFEESVAKHKSKENEAQAWKITKTKGQHTDDQGYRVKDSHDVSKFKSKSKHGNWADLVGESSEPTNWDEFHKAEAKAKVEAEAKAKAEEEFKKAEEERLKSLNDRIAELKVLMERLEAEKSTPAIANGNQNHLKERAVRTAIEISNQQSSKTPISENQPMEKKSQSDTDSGFQISKEAKAKERKKQRKAAKKLKSMKPKESKPLEPLTTSVPAPTATPGSSQSQKSSN